MTEADVHAWVGNKERHWDELGFGPWGIRIEGTLAGWGGLQPFNGDSEVALVLTPEFWGWGKAIFLELTQYAFGELGLTHVVVALPPTRGGARGLPAQVEAVVDHPRCEGHPEIREHDLGDPGHVPVVPLALAAAPVAAARAPPRARPSRYEP